MREGGLNRRGMTLVELLAVVAIVSTLLGVMLPVLASGRESARAAVCLSNIRQLQVANLMHAEDHRGRFVAGAVGIAASNLHRWHGARASVSEAFGAEGSALAAYLEGGATSEALRSCPTFAPTIESLRPRGEGFERGCGGYGYNNAFVGSEREFNRFGVWALVTDGRGSLRNRFAQPSRTIAFADAAFTGRDGLIEYSFAEPRVWPEFPSFSPDPSIHFRHGGRASVGWLDGSASGETRGYSEDGISSKISAKAAGLGWIGTGESNGLYDYE